MIVKNVPVTILKITKKEGVGKATNKEYKFYVATVIDEDANVFELTFKDSLIPEGDQSYTQVRNKEQEVDIEFKPKGFSIGAQIVAFN